MNDNREKSVTGITIIVLILMLSYGIFTTMQGAQLVYIMDDFNIPLGSGGVISAVVSVGNFVGILLSGFLINRIPIYRFVILIYVLFIVILSAFSGSFTYSIFLVLTFCAGFFAKAIDSSLNVSISLLHTDKKRAFFMNMLHMSFGIGSFIGPLLVSVLMSKGIQWKFTYLGLTVICIPVLIIYIVSGRGYFASDEQNNNQSKSTQAVKNRPFDKRVILVVLVLFFYCGHQQGMNTWVPTYMSEYVGSTAVFSSFALSSFWVGIIVSRLLGSFLTQKLALKKLILIGGLAGGVSLIAGILIGTPVVLCICIALTGLFSGGVIPQVMTIGYNTNSLSEGNLTTIMFVGITIGTMILPWIMGKVAASLGMNIAMIINSVSLLLVSLAVAFIKE